jgi:hypothetical protein
MSNDTPSAGEQLIQGHRLRKEAQLILAEGHKLLARTSDLDCDPEIRSRRLRDGHLKLADGHTLLAKSDELIADAISMRRASQVVVAAPGAESEQSS